MLLHDARLDRTTNGKGLVRASMHLLSIDSANFSACVEARDFTLAELKKLDARAKFIRSNTPLTPLKDGSMDDRTSRAKRLSLSYAHLSPPCSSSISDPHAQ